MRVLFDKIKAKIVQNTYLKNIVILMFGSGISQLIPFLMSVVLARLYTSEEFGVFTLFTSIASFLGVFTTLRYEIPVMLPKKKSDAFHLVILSLGISLIVSIIVFLATIIAPYVISGPLFSKNLDSWVFLLGVSIFLTSIFKTLSVWFNRQKHYKTISSNAIVQSSTTAIVNVSNGFAGYTSGGLIIGSISGQFVSALRYSYLFIKEGKALFRRISWARIKKVAHVYREYPKYSLPHSLIDMISITGLPLLIAYLFSEAVLGWYGLMLRALKAPLGILAASLGQVYFQQFSLEVANKRSIKSLFEKTVLRVAFIILPFFILILIWGPEIFSIVFGEKWRQAGIYAQYLTPWLFMSSITSPVSQTPLTLGYVKINMFLGLFSNTLIVSIFLISSYFSNNVEFVFLNIGIIMPVYFLFLLLWYFRIIKNYEKSLLNNK